LARQKAEENKRAQEEIKRKIEAEAMEKKHAAEAKKGIIEERARLEREAIERQQQESQRQMKEIQEQMKRQKEEAFRQMDQERRDRERREQLRREHEESLNRPRKLPKQNQPQPPVVTRPAPLPVAQVSSEGLPFHPETQGEAQLLSEYQQRSPPDPSLPKVYLSKRNGYYWIGQRRFEFEVHDGVYVREGLSLTPFSDWIEKTERVESLRLKGLLSAQPLLLHQSAQTRNVRT